MPKRPRLRPKGVEVDDSWLWWGPPPLPEIAIDDAFAVAAAVLATIGIVLFVVTFVFPLVALTLELILVLIIFTGGLLGRLLFGRPWVIEAKTIGKPHLTRELRVVGLAASRAAIDELADQIKRGQT